MDAEELEGDERDGDEDPEREDRVDGEEADERCCSGCARLGGDG